jgi:predicted nuclease of predicted toxin-antitoxin system
MRLLLDECLPKRLKRAFAGFEISTVPEMGWAGTKDGALLRLVFEASFDAFITVDTGIQYQQNLAGVPLRIVALTVVSNRLEDIEPLIPELLEKLPTLEVGLHRFPPKP